MRASGDNNVPDEIRALMEAACEGTLGGHDLAKLEDYLRGDKAAARQYLLASHMQADLRLMALEHQSLQSSLHLIDEVAGKSTQVGAVPASAKPSVYSRSSWREAGWFLARPTPLSMTVAVLVVGLLLVAMALVTPPIYRVVTAGGDGEDIPPPPPNFVAEFVGLHEPVWAEGQIGVRIGAQLMAGHRVVLQSGLANVRFEDGTEVVLEGPAVFELQTKNSGRLQQGKLVARANDRGRFIVNTPIARVTDLGTEFVVDVDAGGTTDVLVLEGEVEVADEAGEMAARRIATNEGMRLERRAGRLTWTPRWDESRAQSASTAHDLARVPVVSVAAWQPLGGFKCITTDLADSSQPTLESIKLVAGTAAWDSDVNELCDGDMYGEQQASSTLHSFTPIDGTAVVIDFNTSLHPSGYDIHLIASISGSKQFRASQKYRVEARTVHGEFVPLFEVDESLPDNFNFQQFGEVRIVSRRPHGKLAAGVKALRLTFAASPRNGDGGETMYREIDITGKPSRRAK